MRILGAPTAGAPSLTGTSRAPAAVPAPVATARADGAFRPDPDGARRGLDPLPGGGAATPVDAGRADATAPDASFPVRFAVPARRRRPGVAVVSRPPPGDAEGVFRVAGGVALFAGRLRPPAVGRPDRALVAVADFVVFAAFVAVAAFVAWAVLVAWADLATLAGLVVVPGAVALRALVVLVGFPVSVPVRTALAVDPPARRPDALGAEERAAAADGLRGRRVLGAGGATTGAAARRRAFSGSGASASADAGWRGEARRCRSSTNPSAEARRLRLVTWPLATFTSQIASCSRPRDR